MYRYHNPLKNFNPFVITSVFILFLIVMFTSAIPTMMNFIAIIFILFTIYICIIVMRYYNDYYIRNYQKYKEERERKIKD